MSASKSSAGPSSPTINFPPPPSSQPLGAPQQPSDSAGQKPNAGGGAAAAAPKKRVMISGDLDQSPLSESAAPHPNIDLYNPETFEEISNCTSGPLSRVYHQLTVVPSEKPGCNQPVKKRLTDAAPQHAKECVSVLCAPQKIVKLEPVPFVEPTSKGKASASSPSFIVADPSDGLLDCNRYAFDEKKLVEHTFETQEALSSSSSSTAAAVPDTVNVLIGKGLTQKDLDSRLSSLRFNEKGAILKLHSRINRLGQQILKDDIIKSTTPRNQFFFEDAVPSLEKQATARRDQVNLLVEVKQLKFYLLETVDQLEPLFCSILIVDAAKRERLTEAFYFDMNTRALMKQFYPADATSSSEDDDPLIGDGVRRAIFSINQKRICPSLFLILRVYRLFQGDISKSLQHYYESTPKKQLFTKDKHVTNEFLSTFRQKLLSKMSRNHLQPFFWGALHLYRDSQGALELRVSEASRISDFFIMRENLDDEAIFEELNTNINLEYLNSTHWERGKKRSDKTIPGEITVSVTKFDDFHPRTYYKQQEDLLFVQKPKSEPFVAREVREVFWNRDAAERKHEKRGKAAEVVTRLILGKHAKETDERTVVHPDRPMFVLPEVSRLYIYPLSLKMRLKNKNIFIRVRAKSDDKNIDSEGEPSFTKSASQHGASLTKVNTVTIFKAKDPVFSDEICLDLPNEIRELDHVLFTVYQLVSRKGTQSEAPIAHGFLKLWNDGHILWSGRQQVSLYTHSTMVEHQTHGYLRDNSFLDRSEGKLSLFAQVVSPFFAMDEHLSFFFQQMDRYARLPRGASNSSATSTASSLLPLRQAIKNVKKIDPTVAVEYSGVILNHLLRIIRDENLQGPDQVIRDVAFCSLLNLMYTLDSTCSSAASKSGLFSGQLLNAFDSYLQFDFDFSDVHMALVEQWINFIDNALLHPPSLRSRSPTKSPSSDDLSPFDTESSSNMELSPEAEEVPSPRDEGLNEEQTAESSPPNGDGDVIAEVNATPLPPPTESAKKESAASEKPTTPAAASDDLSAEQRQELEQDFQKQQQHAVAFMFKFSGWLFSLISKSMILNLYERGMLARVNNFPRTNSFPPVFWGKLTTLVNRISRAVLLKFSSFTHLQRLQTNVQSLSMISRDIVLLLNNSLALFLVQAFGVMDRGVVIRLVAQYAHALMPLPPPTSSPDALPSRPAHTRQRRHHELQSSGLSNINSINILAGYLIGFFSIIMRSGNFMSLMVPLTQAPVPGQIVSNIAVSNITALRDSASNGFFLNSLFADHIVFMLCHKSKPIQYAAERFLQEMLLRQATDRRYSSPQTASLVCTAHWGCFVLRWLDKFEIWKENSAETIKIAQAALTLCSKQIDDLQNKLNDLDETRRQSQFAASAAASTNASMASMSVRRGGLKKDGSSAVPALTETGTTPASPTSAASTAADDQYSKDFQRLMNDLSRWKQRYRESEHQLTLEKLNVTKARRNLLACVVHILATMDRTVLQTWWKIEAPTIKCVFIEALTMAMEAFRFDPYPVISRAELEEFALSTSQNEDDAEETVSNLSDNTETSSSSESKIMGFIRRRSTHTNSRSSRGNKSSNALKKGASSSASKPSSSTSFNVRPDVDDAGGDEELRESDGTPADQDEKREIFEKNLSADIGFLVLELLSQFVTDNDKELKEINTSDSAAATRSPLMDKLVGLVASFLDSHLAENVVLSGYIFIERFLKEHRRVIFCKRFDYSEKLCSLILRHCNFVVPSLRKNATLLLYSFIVNGYEEIKSFPRLKVLLTLALSDIISDLRDERSLKTSIREILDMATSAPVKGNKSFVDNMRDLCDRLDTLLNDVKKISEYQNTHVDDETMADLFERIANVYTYAPDLKAVWLLRLAEHQEQHRNYVEAGQCLLRVVALITEYFLSVSNNNRELEGVPIHLLKKCIPSYTSKEIPDEIRNELMREGGNLLQSGHFSRDGIVRILERAIGYLDRGECWEYCIDAYQLLIPYYHRAYDFRKMTLCYQHLLTCCNSVIEGNTRVFGTYYRVFFFGKALSPELNQHEFVYKFPKITRLSEANDYLQRQLEAKVGKGKVKFISTARTIDPASLDCDNFVHVQTTFVKPLAMESEDMVPRTTYFEKNTNYAFFVYETPFTQGKEGVAENEQVEDQYKKKTILCVQLPTGPATSTASPAKASASSSSAKQMQHQVNHRFPATKIRLEVTSRQEVILSPIDNAIEQIEEKLQQLTTQLAMDPPRLHMLHMSLTGIVRLQVHAGPKEFARVFLNPENPPSAYPADRVAELRSKLRTLLELCDKGIHLSRQLISPSQMPFQNDLELGNTETIEYFAKYLN